MIQNFDAFESNLVMSTLSPEDMESECSKGKSQQLSESQDVNINMSTEQAPNNAKNRGNDDSEQHHTTQSSESISLRKRVHSKANGDNTLDNSPVEQSRHNSLDIVRKRRRTSTENQQNTFLPSLNNDIQLPNRTEKSAALVHNVDSEDIQVVFAADSNQMDDNSRNRDSLAVISLQHYDRSQENNRNVRDHRPKMRNTFKVCFTGNSQPDVDFGKVLAECSDEE